MLFSFLNCESKAFAFGMEIKYFRRKGNKSVYLTTTTTTKMMTAWVAQLARFLPESLEIYSMLMHST